MKISWGYDLKNENFVMWFDNTCHYANEIVIDGEMQPHKEGEAEITTWAIVTDTQFANGKTYKTLTFKAYTKAEKPPLGVIPCYLAAEKRIIDLADAIKRQLKAEKPDYDLIKRWANEIENQCDLIDYDRCFDE